MTQFKKITKESFCLIKAIDLNDLRLIEVKKQKTCVPRAPLTWTIYSRRFDEAINEISLRKRHFRHFLDPKQEKTAITHRTRNRIIGTPGESRIAAIITLIYEVIY